MCVCRDRWSQRSLHPAICRSSLNTSPTPATRCLAAGWPLRWEAKWSGWTGWYSGLKIIAGASKIQRCCPGRPTWRRVTLHLVFMVLPWTLQSWDQVNLDMMLWFVCLFVFLCYFNGKIILSKIQRSHIRQGVSSNKKMTFAVLYVQILCLFIVLSMLRARRRKLLKLKAFTHR